MAALDFHRITKFFLFKKTEKNACRSRAKFFANFKILYKKRFKKSNIFLKYGKKSKDKKRYNKLYA